MGVFDSLLTWRGWEVPPGHQIPWPSLWAEDASQSWSCHGKHCGGMASTWQEQPRNKRGVEKQDWALRNIRERQGLQCLHIPQIRGTKSRIIKGASEAHKGWMKKQTKMGWPSGKSSRFQRHHGPVMRKSEGTQQVWPQLWRESPEPQGGRLLFCGRRIRSQVEHCWSGRRTLMKQFASWRGEHFWPSPALVWFKMEPGMVSGTEWSGTQGRGNSGGVGLLFLLLCPWAAH